MNGNRPTGAVPIRAVVYARYSTDLQNERSIEDQVALCQAYAARENLKVVEVYNDKACSGASIKGRDGLIRLLERARDGSSTSSLSRRLIVCRAIWKTLLVSTSVCLSRD